MKCISCGNELSEKSRFCNACGCKQPESIDPDHDDQIVGEPCDSISPQNEAGLSEENNQSSQATITQATRWKVAVLAITIILILLAAIFIPMHNRNKTFSEAITEMRNGNYYEAMKLMESIVDHKQKDIQNTIYEHLLSLCEIDDYDGADSCLLNLRYADVLPENIINKFDDEVSYSKAEYFLQEEEFIKAYGHFNVLGDYEDSLDRAQEIFDAHMDVFYENAIYLYEEENWFNASWNLAKERFTKLGDYKDSVDYLRRMEFVEAMNGTYEYSNGIFDYRYIFDGFSFTRYEKFASSTYIATKEPYELQIYPYNEWFCMYRGSDKEGTAYCLDNNYISIFPAHIEDGAVVIDDADGHTWEQMKKISTKTAELRSPIIGMTAEEIRLSTWGDPDKINKSTYSWGTSEQWVYEGYRYIYLDDGIVTSIQE